MTFLQTAKMKRRLEHKLQNMNIRSTKYYTRLFLALLWKQSEHLNAPNFVSTYFAEFRSFVVSPNNTIFMVHVSPTLSIIALSSTTVNPQGKSQMKTTKSINRQAKISKQVFVPAVKSATIKFVCFSSSLEWTRQNKNKIFSSKILQVLFNKVQTVKI